MEFEPDVFKQMAGLILMYDTDNYLYLHVSCDEDCGKCITLLKAENKKYEYLTDYLPVKPNMPIYLKLRLLGSSVQFFYGYEEDRLGKIGPEERFRLAAFLAVCVYALSAVKPEG